jgi:hypothetical protein
MMLRKHNGYWAIFQGNTPLATFADFHSAFRALYLLWEELTK